MKKITLILFAIAMVFAARFIVACEGNSTNNESVSRIVSVNGTITEVLAAFGMEKQLVGVDVTSTFPISVQQLPKVGRDRDIAVEGILSLNPTDVIALDGQINAQKKQQLADAGINVVEVAHTFSVDGAKQLINVLGEKLNKLERAQQLVLEIDDQINNIMSKEHKVKVLFVYARGAGTLLVAGKETQLDAMINLAGGKNVASDLVQFKPLTAEGLVTYNPDVVLMFEHGVQSLQGESAVFNLPGMDQTRAGQEKNIIIMDSQYLAGFGPRLGKAVTTLNQQLSQF
jgi:iron complex transport system substrate-binding protein